MAEQIRIISMEIQSEELSRISHLLKIINLLFLKINKLFYREVKKIPNKIIKICDKKQEHLSNNTTKFKVSNNSLLILCKDTNNIQNHNRKLTPSKQNLAARANSALSNNTQPQNTQLIQGINPAIINFDRT